MRPPGRLPAMYRNGRVGSPALGIHTGFTARPAPRARSLPHATVRMRYSPGGGAVGRRLCPLAEAPGGPNCAGHLIGRTAPWDFRRGPAVPLGRGRPEGWSVHPDHTRLHGAQPGRGRGHDRPHDLQIRLYQGRAPGHELYQRGEEEADARSWARSGADRRLRTRPYRAARTRRPPAQTLESHAATLGGRARSEGEGHAGDAPEITRVPRPARSHRCAGVHCAGLGSMRVTVPEAATSLRSCKMTGEQYQLRILDKSIAKRDLTP